MEGKDGRELASNGLHGACAKRKRSCKLPVHIHAAISSKRAKSERGRSSSTECASNEVFSRIEEEEGRCSENESCSVPKSSSRFLYYEKGEWCDFSLDVGVLLSESLRAGKSVVEVFTLGCLHLVNFVLMMQINTKTGHRRSIAWIDEKGKCFFPPLPFDGWPTCQSDFLNCVQNAETLSEKGRRFSKSEDFLFRDDVGVKNTELAALGCAAGYVTTEAACGELVKRQSLQSNEELDSDAESVVSCHPLCREEPSLEIMKSCMPPPPPVSEACKYPRVGDKLVQLDDGDLRYVLIKNKFLEGLGILGKNASVKAIYHDSHTTPSSKARLLAFQRQMEVTKQTRGNPNVHYAWHGTSKDGVCGIVLHGFGQPMNNNGAAFGIGVYLAPENCSHVSAIYSDYDENGEQHAVLCKVILGNTELVSYGSEQYHPSSEEYDTGVDNLLKPKRYIVWSTHMNTNILPLYVVNFKLFTEWHELLLALRGKHMMSAHSLRNASDICIDQICSSPKVATNLKSGMQVKPQSISFPLLLSILKSKLPETAILLLHKHYLSYKAQRISKVQLSDAFRRVVGDEKLSHAIMLMKKQVGCGKLEVKGNDGQSRSSTPSCEASEVCYTSQALS